MSFPKGVSGNPKGRPPKSRAMAELLNRSLNRMVQVDDEHRISGKKLLAQLVTEAIVTGKLTFPGEGQPTTLSNKDWIEFTRWAFQYLDPPVSKVAPTMPDGVNPYMSMSKDELMALAKQVTQNVSDD